MPPALTNNNYTFPSFLLLSNTTVAQRCVQQCQISTVLLVVQHVAHPLHVVFDSAGHKCLTIVVGVLSSKHELRSECVVNIGNGLFLLRMRLSYSALQLMSKSSFSSFYPFFSLLRAVCHFAPTFIICYPVHVASFWHTFFTFDAAKVRRFLKPHNILG